MDWGSMMAAWANLSTGRRYASTRPRLTKSFAQSAWDAVQAPTSPASSESALLAEAPAMSERNPMAAATARRLRFSMIRPLCDLIYETSPSPASPPDHLPHGYPHRSPFSVLCESVRNWSPDGIGPTTLQCRCHGPAFLMPNLALRQV